MKDNLGYLSQAHKRQLNDRRANTATDDELTFYRDNMAASLHTINETQRENTMVTSKSTSKNNRNSRPTSIIRARLSRNSSFIDNSRS